MNFYKILFIICNILYKLLQIILKYHIYWFTKKFVTCEIDLIGELQIFY